MSLFFCTPPPSGFTVVFDYQKWRTRYPEFNDTVTSDLAAEYFDEATLYFRNDGSVPVSSAAKQLLYLNMLVAHIAQLNVGTTANPASAVVGRVSSASEGSVSVAAEADYPPGTPQWFNQTKYGSTFWVATGAQRTMRYVPGPRRLINPFPFR